MKFKLKDKKIILINITMFSILIVAISLAFTSSFYMKSLSDNLETNSTDVIKPSKNTVRSPKIQEYIDTVKKEDLIEEVDIKKEVTSILTTNEDRYESHIFDYVTGEEITIDDLIKSDKKTDFEEKVEELLYLKYPKFIASVLNSGKGRDVYYLKDNELVIYYYDYVIDPAPKENLYLTVNYNEIKDYLNINVDLDSEYVNEDGSVINPAKKLIALTFDDGPGPYTDRLVNILNDNLVNATFFMLGSNLEKYKSTVLNVYNSGNEIGYHSYAHTNFKRQNIKQIVAEFNTSNEILKSITGVPFSLVRPPYGSINEEIKEALDVSFILWNVDTEDWRHKDTDYLLNYTLENIQDGSIVLFHDIHASSVDAIEKILPYLYVEGYTVVTVSELAEYFNTTLEYHKAYRYFTK